MSSLHEIERLSEKIKERARSKLNQADRLRAESSELNALAGELDRAIETQKAANDQMEAKKMVCGVVGVKP